VAVNTEEKSWFKTHADMLVVLTGVLGSVLWMNHQFSELDKKFVESDKNIALLKSDIAVIKAILVVKDVFPKELAYTVHSNKVKAEEVKE
jgi:hypothetical protein